MAFTVVEVTLIASAASAASSFLTAVLSGRMAANAAIRASKAAAGPAAEEALTQRFNSLVDRMTEERLRLEREIEKQAKVATDLEVMVIRLVDWGDEVVARMALLGVEHPPRPRFQDISEMLLVDLRRAVGR